MSKEEETINQQDDGLLSQDELLTQQIILEKDQRIAQLEKEKASLTNRTLLVHEKNQALMSSEILQQKLAMLEFEDRKMQMQLKQAERFAASKAFPSNTPEQCYVLMQAGEEMGVSPIVALNMLYIVNGHINPYGDKMLGYILSKGYKVEYSNETIHYKDKSRLSEVTVRVFNDNGEDYTETAKSTDQIIIKSLIKGAASFALKNKLRFHAIRMIASFHLPHLFMGCGDNFTPDFEQWKENESTKLKDKDGNTIVVIKNKELVALIENAKSNEELLMIHDNHKSEISKDINLVSLLGKKKKEFDVPDIDKKKIKELIEESESLEDLNSISNEHGDFIQSDKDLNKLFTQTQKSLSDE